MQFNRRTLFKALALFGITVPTITLADAPIPKDACILCGFADGFDAGLKAWGGPTYVLRCTDLSGCQARQINIKLQTPTPWQARNQCCVQCRSEYDERGFALKPRWLHDN